MKLSISFIIYWLLLPFINFLFWFFISHSRIVTRWLCSIEASFQINNNNANDLRKGSEGSLENMLARSKQTLASENVVTVEASCHRPASEETLLCQRNHIPAYPPLAERFEVKFENTKQFDQYRAERLASMDVTMLVETYLNTDTMVVHYKGMDRRRRSPSECESFEHHFLEDKESVCMAVVYAQNANNSYHIARIDQDIDIYGLSISNPDPSQIDKYSNKFPLNEYNENKFWPTGFFRKVPKERGRERTKDKLGEFLKYFQEINQDLEKKLNDRQIVAGDDLVVMVLNQGEMDLFMNFACSCRLHNITLHKVIVFAGSMEIVSMVESTGAMALYHVGYASVSKRASTDYLDRVFVDMMWYKAFSVYLILRRGINMLFQDVDLVWFREPFDYFRDYLKKNQPAMEMSGAYVEAFFSDDGQRSKRYTPFYANSGFYYLLASERSEYFTWSIMTAMDSIQVLGSHQNVFTTRLIEGLALNFQHAKILPLEVFPTGIMYHHEQEYMRRLKRKELFPYNFHMCWTQGKPDKLVYLRRASMWYLTPQCSPLDQLVEHNPSEGEEEEEEVEPQHNSGGGMVYELVEQWMREQKSMEERWSELSSKCCQLMTDAP